MARSNRHRKPSLIAVVGLAVVGYAAKKTRPRWQPQVRKVTRKAIEAAPVAVVKKDEDTLSELASNISFDVGGPFPEPVRDAVTAGVAQTVAALTGMDAQSKTPMDLALGYQQWVEDTAYDAVIKSGAKEDEDPASPHGKVTNAVETMVYQLTGRQWSFWDMHAVKLGL